MQTDVTLAARPNLSLRIADDLRHRIIAGELGEDERLNEVDLAAQLGISRTPLREALNQLVSEGFVYSLPRRGFFVAALSLEELEQLYVIRQLLDPEALRLAGMPKAAQLTRLEGLNRQIERARNPRRIVDLDDQWHLTLLEHCPNRILIDLIQLHMRRTRRYEWAYMSAGHHLTTVIAEHEEIIAHLEENNLRKACRALKGNMTSAVEPLLEWLRARDQHAKTNGPASANPRREPA